MGSASGVLQAVNSLGMSVGVAGIGAIFFGLVGAGRAGDFVERPEWAALVADRVAGVRVRRLRSGSHGAPATAPLRRRPREPTSRERAGAGHLIAAHAAGLSARRGWRSCPPLLTLLSDPLP